MKVWKLGKNPLTFLFWDQLANLRVKKYHSSLKSSQLPLPFFTPRSLCHSNVKRTLTNILWNGLFLLFHVLKHRLNLKSFHGNTQTGGKLTFCYAARFRQLEGGGIYFPFFLWLANELYSNVNVYPIISIHGVFLNLYQFKNDTPQGNIFRAFLQIKFAGTCSKLILFTILGDEMK